MARVNLRKFKVVRPFPLFGRYLGTGERLYLPDDDAQPLLETGHIAPVEAPAVLNAPGPWIVPTTR